MKEEIRALEGRAGLMGIRGWLVRGLECQALDFAFKLKQGRKEAAANLRSSFCTTAVMFSALPTHIHTD